MPSIEEHCQHSERIYGVRGEDIHNWIDEPSQRKCRHDLNSVQTAIQIFGKLYGVEMVENIFLDHLRADSEEQKRRAELAEELSGPKRWMKILFRLWQKLRH
jgi:hypothetical protein